MFLSETTLLWSAVAALSAYIVGKWAFTKDTAVENQRRAASHLASTLKEYGLVRTPEFLVDYSVGDYSGMADKIVKLADLFKSGEDAVVKEFKVTADRVIDHMLTTEEGRAVIAAKLNAAVKVA